MLCRPQLRIPTLASGHAHILREGAKRILKFIPLKGVAERLIKRMRQIRKSTDTVGSMLNNVRENDRHFDALIEPKCVCASYPAKWLKVRALKGHFALLSYEYDGPGVEAFQCSNKTPVSLDNEGGYYMAWDVLSDFYNNLPVHLKIMIPISHVRNIAAWVTKTLPVFFEGDRNVVGIGSIM